MIILYSESAGLTGVVYTWYLDSAVGSGVDGWFNGDVYVEGESIPLGTGLYLNCPTANVGVQYAGQVYNGALTNDLPNIGYNMVGNCTPVDIDIQDLKLVGAGGDGNEMIIGYSESAGLTGVVYTWYLDSAVGSGIDGWFNGDIYVEDMPLAPGEGVYLNCPTANVKFVIPSALKK